MRAVRLQVPQDRRARSDAPHWPDKMKCWSLTFWAGTRACWRAILKCPMRSRPLTWLLLSVMLFLGGAYAWRLVNQRAARRVVMSTAQPRAQSPLSHAPLIVRPSPISLLSQPSALNSPPAPAQVPLTHHASSLSSPIRPHPSPIWFVAQPPSSSKTPCSILLNLSSWGSLTICRPRAIPAHT